MYTYISLVHHAHDVFVKCMNNKIENQDHVRDSIVGNVEKRGISGGQRKRVNIGLEIVAEPAIIFLDEVDVAAGMCACICIPRISVRTLLVCVVCNVDGWMGG